MNRLQSPKAPHSKHTILSHFHLSDSQLSTPFLSPGAARGAERRSSPSYSLFSPLHYERRYAYPLVVWLHGEGGCEQELRQVMRHVSVRNYVAVAARGAAKAADFEQGYAWRQSAPGIMEAAARVELCMEAAQKRYHVHAQRVFIAGYGCGGTMALRLGLQYPEWFAGAISLGGPMPRGRCPLGRVNTARRLPLLLSSCSDSMHYPPSRVADDLRLLHAAGFSLSLRQYPGEHELTTLMLADMDRWMMERVCPATASASS